MFIADAKLFRASLANGFDGHGCEQGERNKCQRIRPAAQV
jgi:hypothetical protein